MTTRRKELALLRGARLKIGHAWHSLQVVTGATAAMNKLRAADLLLIELMKPAPVRTRRSKRSSKRRTSKRKR